MKLKEVYFTSRELDVVACIANTRGIKKTASMLDISPRTVETHVKNIFQKTSGNSQESIKDFIAKSGMALKIQEHYYKILSEHYLFQQLRKISHSISRAKAAITITTTTKKEVIIEKIIRYLKEANVDIQVNAENSNKYKLDILSLKTSDELQDEKNILVYTNELLDVTGSKATLLDCTTQAKTHISIFKILGILVPNIKFDKQIQEIKDVFSNIHRGGSGVRIADSEDAAENVEMLQDEDNGDSTNEVRKMTRKLFSSKYILIGVLAVTLLISTIVWKLFMSSIVTTQKVTNSVIPVSYFVNHVKQIAELKRYLEQYKQASVVGLSGMGKTQLARMYVRENTDKYDIIWFFDCNLDLNSQFLDLAKAINKTYGPGTIPENIESIKQDAMKYLASKEKWLLVFDNLKIKENAKVKDLIEWEHNGHVIFGSQDGEGLPNVVQMTAFIHKDASALANNILKNSDPKTAEFLATEFKGYPILIVQGAQLLNQIKGLSLDAYKAKIQGSADKIKLNIELAMSELRPSTRDLLQKIALINNQAFSKELLKITSINPEQVDNDIYDLSKFALISSIDLDPDNPVFAMHDVIYNSIKSLNQDSFNTNILSDIIDKINAKIPRGASTKYKFFHDDLTLKGNIEVMVDNSEKYNVPFNQTLKLRSNLLAFYISDLDYYNCKKMKNWLVEKERQQIFDLKTMDNDMKADYSSINLDIAIYEEFAYSNFDEAIQRYKKAEDIMQNIPGYPELKFIIQSQTAQMHVWGGDLFNTEQYLLRAEQIIDQYPDADLDKGLYWFIKAKFFLMKGDNPKALAAINKNLEVDAYLDQNDSFTASTYMLKAEILNVFAEYDQAYSIIKKIFDQEIGDKIPDHELQARLLIPLASIEANLGKLDIALFHIEQACKIFQTDNAEVNTDYASALVAKGDVLAKKQQFKAALESYLEAEKVYHNRYQENFGKTQDILYLLSQAAKTTYAAKDKNNMERLQQLLIKHFGNNNPTVQAIISPHAS
jgi:DNA-binding CsgD family transcriptional regulator